MAISKNKNKNIQMNVDYYSLVVGFILTIWSLEFYLSVRQHFCYDSTTLPKELQGRISNETFLSAQKYQKAKSYFSMFSSIVDLAFTLFVLHRGLIAITWQYALHLNQSYLGLDASYEISRSLTFLGVHTVVSQLIHLPLGLYSTFVIEEKFGFNKQTLSGYFADMAKSLFLQVVLGVPIVAGLLRVIQWGGDMFWLYAWVFVFVVIMIFMTIFPTVIQPMFNKFTELEQGELRAGIEALAKRVNFPLTKIYCMDASKRSSHSNAYFYGFFKNKRIVLFDTLIQQVDTQGVIAIIGHELGHYAMNHVLKNIILVQSHMLAFLYLFGISLTNDKLFQAFDFHDSKPALIGLVLFSFIYDPFEHLFGLFMHVISRRFEYQADAYAVNLGLELNDPLTKIHEKNLSCLNPDPLYSAYHFSHPTLVERIREMDRLKAAAAAKDSKKKK